jgi:early secretory antigenic target protein ESAT-6
MANDGMLLVNFGAMQQASSDIHKAITRMQSQLDQLESDAKPLIATWNGAAQEAYAQRQAKWRHASADLNHILQNIKRAVDQSTEDYVNTEKQATHRFQ